MAKQLKKPRTRSPSSKKEQLRLKELTLFEESALKEGFKRIAGVDEAGRGPLAGPVVAAACIIPPFFFIEGVDDSKKLAPEKRQEIYEFIMSNEQILYGIGIVSSEEIDRINIYQATVVAMWQAVSKLQQQPDCLFVDGMQLQHPEIYCKKIVGGDGRSQSIAAASVIAKVTRDRIMREYAEQWPQYGFERHKGYSTEQHLEALREHGPCPIHRMTFEPLKSLYNLNKTEVQLELC